MIKRLELIIYGAVQGVNFRYYARTRAQDLNLTGWVKNASDGSVEVVAEGEREHLEKLRDWCRQGPRWARVERVAEAWQEASGAFKSFDLKW